MHPPFGRNVVRFGPPQCAINAAFTASAVILLSSHTAIDQNRLGLLVTLVGIADVNPFRTAGGAEDRKAQHLARRRRRCNLNCLIASHRANEKQSR